MRETRERHERERERAGKRKCERERRQASGHRLRMHKYVVCFPGSDDVPEDQLESEAGDLLQEVPLAVDGLLLGRDWSAAIVNYLGTYRDMFTTPRRTLGHCSVSYPSHPWLVAARGWQRQTPGMADADEGGNARVGRSMLNHVGLACAGHLLPAEEMRDLRAEGP